MIMPTEKLIVDGCYGIACNRHASCQLYENVNGSKPEASVIIGSCNIGLKDHPRFIPMRAPITAAMVKSYSEEHQIGFMEAKRELVNKNG